MQNKNDKCEYDVKREILYMAIYQATADGKLKGKSDKSAFENTCNGVLPQEQNSPVLSESPLLFLQGVERKLP